MRNYRKQLSYQRILALEEATREEGKVFPRD